MSYRIEQTREQTADAFALISRADVTEIRLVSSSITCRLSPRSELPRLWFDIGFFPEAAEVDENEIIVSTRFTFGARDGEKGVGKEVISVAASFEARYVLLEPDPRPTDAQMDAFKRGNAIFNCWPYFREYVQSVVGRMGFPPPTVPFLRLVPKRPIDKERLPEVERAPHTQSEPSQDLSRARRRARKSRP